MNYWGVEMNAFMLDSSMLSTYMECKRKFWLRYGRHLRGTGRNLAPEFGTAMHTALDCYYGGGELKEVQRVFCGAYKNDPAETLRTQEKGRKILKKYVERYQGIMREMETLETEFCFKMRLEGLEGVILIGRIDKVLKWGNTLYVMDHKTSREIGTRFFNGFAPNIQMDIYYKVGEIYAKELGIPYGGVIIDAIQVAKTKEDFMRDTVVRSEEDYRAFIVIMQDLVGEIIRYSREGTWTPNYGACSGWGGCGFRKACVHYGGEGFETMLEDRGEFMVDEWSPIRDGDNVKEFRG